MLENIIAIIIILLIVAFVLFFYYVYVTKKLGSDNYISSNPDTLEYLTKNMSDIMVAIFKENLRDMNLSKTDYELRKKQKDELRRSFKDASNGNRYAKAYIISFFRECLQTNPSTLVTEESVDKIIHFNTPANMTSRDKWETLLHVYKNCKDSNGEPYGDKALSALIKNYKLNTPRTSETGDIYYEITKEDINNVYSQLITENSLTFIDKLDIIAQRIFSDTRGLGAASTLFDYSVDEIDCGVSGIPSDSFELAVLKKDSKVKYSYDSIWIMLSGANIHLSFLGFGKQSELIRVCQNIYKYNAPAYLSRGKGYVISTMQDGSRILVVRPPFTDSWAFFSRKFDTMPAADIEKVIPAKGNHIAITLIKWLIKGNCNIAVTGTQGCGKSTLVKTIIQFISLVHTLRIQEKAFELNLRYTYPDRNIVSFQETDSISIQEGITTQKKSNGSVNIFGEVASPEEAVIMLQTAMVASRFCLFTNHANTARELIISLRNNLLQSGVFHSEKAAEETVANVINIDIHLEKDKYGNRYIERISEIIPIRDRRYPSEINTELSIDEKLKLDQMEYFRRTTDRELFTTVNIMEYRDGEYVYTHDISPELHDKIYKTLSVEEESSFIEELNAIKKGA